MLSGRTQSAAINVKFFQQAFEQNPGFGWNFAKLLLKCILSLKAPASRKGSGAGDALMASDAESKSKKKQGKKAIGDDEEGDGSRSNHQRLQAVDLFSYLIKDAFASEAARE